MLFKYKEGYGTILVQNKTENFVDLLPEDLSSRMIQCTRYRITGEGRGLAREKPHK